MPDTGPTPGPDRQIGYPDWYVREKFREYKRWSLEEMGAMPFIEVELAYAVYILEITYGIKWHAWNHGTNPF